MRWKICCTMPGLGDCQMTYDIGIQFFAHSIGFELTAIPAHYLHGTALLLSFFMFVDCAGQQMENGSSVGVFYLSCCFTRDAACTSTGRIVQLRQRRAARACWRFFLALPGHPLPGFTGRVTEFTSRGKRSACPSIVHGCQSQRNICVVTYIPMCKAFMKSYDLPDTSMELPARVFRCM